MTNNCPFRAHKSKWPTRTEPTPCRARESLEGTFGPESEHFLPLSMDITSEADVIWAVSEAEAKFGKIDVLVNNAGYTHLCTIEEFSDAEARALFDVNVFGLLNCVRAVLPGMRACRSGHVFNVSSLGAYNVGPLSGVYRATKRAVKAISETLAQELAVGTPVYFAGANGALLALLDRAFYAVSVHGRRFAGKPACAVTTLWRAGPTSALDELNCYFTFSGMPVASSTYRTMMLNSGDNSFGEDMLRQLGENMAHLTRATRA